MSQESRRGLSRVLMLYRPENFAAAIEAFSTALGIDDFADPVDMAVFGIRVTLSHAGGLELICPLNHDGFGATVWQVLETRGEGLYGIVWRVPNLEEGEMRAASAGYPRRGGRINCFDAGSIWQGYWSLALEAGLEPVANVELTLIQLDPPNDKTSR